jgi:hypothetical protein
MPPTPELFPGGSWETPWTPSSGDTELELDYEAGGAHATVEGTGRLQLTLDGTSIDPIPVDGPALYQLTEHSHHSGHQLRIQPSDELCIWSVSFSPGVPAVGP